VKLNLIVRFAEGITKVTASKPLKVAKLELGDDCAFVSSRHWNIIGGYLSAAEEFNPTAA